MDLTNPAQLSALIMAIAGVLVAVAKVVQVI